MTWLTGTRAPSGATISRSTPAAGDATSITALSVSTATIGSSFITSSPTRLSQDWIVPSVMVSPRTGMVISIAIAPLRRSPCRRRTRGEAPIVRGEVLPAVRPDENHVLDAHPSPAIPVDPGLDGVDLALAEDVVARGMEERRLVPLEAEAVAEPVGKVVPVAGRRD